MASNYRAYAVHTAVATLNIAPVEQLVVPVMSWEVLIYQLEELACYIGGDTLVVGRIEPDHITLAHFSPSDIGHIF